MENKQKQVFFNSVIIFAIIAVSCASSTKRKAPLYGLHALNDQKVFHAPNITINLGSSNISLNHDVIIVLKNHSCNFTKLTHSWNTKYSKKGHFKMMKRFKFGKFAGGHFRISMDNIESLREDPEVKHIENNYKIKISDIHIADAYDKCLSDRLSKECIQETPGRELWGISRTNNREMPYYVSASFTYLSGDGAGVDAYVVDTGVYEEHSEFEGRAKMAFKASEIVEEATDLHGHGTHVSGTIAGKTYGLARNANIIGVKVLNGDGAGTLSSLLEGLQWVYTDYVTKKSNGNKTKGVVNLSLGGAPGEITTLDEAAITLITDAGLTFVVAAGNDNADACSVSPARLSVAVTVGSIDISDMISSFSNHGPCVDILSPGENILSAFIGSPTTSAILSGTSMSTPHVTGVIARYLSQSCNDGPTPSSVKAWLLNSATLNAVNLDTKLSTPNKVIFMHCLAGDLDSGDGNGGAVFKDADSLFYVYVGIGVLALLCLVVLTFTCITYQKVRRVNENINQKERLFYKPPTYQTFDPHQGQQAAPHV